MTRAMIGVPGAISATSQALARSGVGMPHGWTLCGYMGLIAAVNRWARPMTWVIDLWMLEKDHCHKAMLRSIERANKYNSTKE